MHIRKTTPQDLDQLEELFEIGRITQIKSGNPNQWEEGYPGRQLLESDLAQGVSYVVESQGEIVGSFALFSEPDPDYDDLVGQWLNDLPYHTIHRLVSNGRLKGVGSFIIESVLEKCPNVRVDTHEKNLQVRRLMEKFNFKYCGKLKLSNGKNGRIAYQYSRVDRK